jgi:hypothetical protein
VGSRRIIISPALKPSHFVSAAVLIFRSNGQKQNECHHKSCNAREYSPPVSNFEQFEHEPSVFVTATPPANKVPAAIKGAAFWDRTLDKERAERNMGE